MALFHNNSYWNTKWVMMPSSMLIAFILYSTNHNKINIYETAVLWKAWMLPDFSCACLMGTIILLLHCRINGFQRKYDYKDYYLEVSAFIICKKERLSNHIPNILQIFLVLPFHGQPRTQILWITLYNRTWVLQQ